MEEIFELAYFYFMCKYLRQETKDYFIGDLFKRILQGEN